MINEHTVAGLSVSTHPRDGAGYWLGAGKLAALTALLAFEILALSLYWDTGRLVYGTGPIRWIDVWVADLVRAMLAFGTVYTLFGFFSARPAWRTFAWQIANAPVSPVFIATHAFAMCAFVLVPRPLFDASIPAGNPDLIAAFWMLSGVIAIGCAIGAVVPVQAAFEFAVRTRSALAPACIGGIVTLMAETFSESIWRRMSALTFELVAAMLRPFRSDLVVDPADLTIGTHRFQVTIVSECSGLEGAALMLVFGMMWLWLFRGEYRFPRAFILIPLGVATIWLLNSVRIASLILIGHSGAEEIAMGGFHSQAGWITLNIVALGFAWISHRVVWLRTAPNQAYATPVPSYNPTAWYMLPFLGILLAGMVATAATDGFDWLYPLRFIAAGTALWCFRSKYKELDWRMSWATPVIGLAVFVLWLGFDRLIGQSAMGSRLGAHLNELPLPGMLLWIAIRILASTITVPIAEELAFRGFLLRRTVSPDFETANVRDSNFAGLAITSVLFGLFHGEYWIAGILAGAAYGLAYRYQGKFGDAVGAHAVTNALLCAWVLLTGDWHLW